MFQLHDTVSFQVSAQSMRRPGRKQNGERTGPTLGIRICLLSENYNTQNRCCHQYFTGRQAERKNFPGFHRTEFLYLSKKSGIIIRFPQEIRPVGAAGLTGEDNEWNEGFCMTYKEEFITFMVRSGVLTFGDFTTKSGRKTPILSIPETTRPVPRRPSWGLLCRLHPGEHAPGHHLPVWARL